MKCKDTTKNSLLFEKRYKILVPFLSILFILMAVNTKQLQAQMFSVGESGPSYNRPMSELYVGVGSMDANFKGESNLNGAGAFGYSGPVLSVGYNTGGINLYLSTGGKITGVDDRAYFHTGGNFDFGLSLYRSSKINVKIPIRIASRYTNITNNQTFRFLTVNRFQFGMIAAGAGINGVWRPAKNFRIEVGAVPTYGFSFATGGSLGGSIGTVNAHGKLYFDRLFNDKGLSIGYKYDLRSYDIEDDIYDYDMKGHSVEIGVTF
ncbi:hypothetical protein [Fodinibius sp.]|uniref:hypothetical protein n=1 Tax=Fodinibius sp. TaxID=1872440 RepID=UPI002ACE463D|nr:hypothetical protein [Fodinibius sp.]MDZ7660395.1 hypothetical protein [Fodinibius sp.]